MSSKFELNIEGLREIMKSSEMQSILQQAVTEVRSSAHGDYGTAVREASYVAVGTCYPDSEAAAKDNYENNTLLKALQATGLKTSKG